jgi:hypothetical protein
MIHKLYKKGLRNVSGTPLGKANKINLKHINALRDTFTDGVRHDLTLTDHLMAHCPVQAAKRAYGLKPVAKNLMERHEVIESGFH